MEDFILEMRSISKEFPGVKALSDVTFKVKRGEIHALVGENGAGKSTLMKILSGVYPFKNYTGDIVLNGKVQEFHNIRSSEEAGIAIIYQELALVKYMSIQENIFLGNEIASGGVIDKDKMFRETERLLHEVHLNLHPDTKVIGLGVGQQQQVEIAKALSKKADVLILDEPTAALTEEESDNLFKILKELNKKGVTCIFISHRLKEIFEITNRITVLRDGRTITTQEVKDLNEDKLISLMVGRELTQRFPRKPHQAGETVLKVSNWSVIDPETDMLECENITFEAKKGEILGIAGLMGAGRTELAMSLFGVWGKKAGGEIALNGKFLHLESAHEAIEAGISLLSEDRKRYGLVLDMDIMKNITLSSLNSISKSGVINMNEEIKHSNQYVAELNIKTPSIEQKARNLSGGNQQKVVIGKWLMTQPKVLILDEPTRGIDVGAKFEIYNIMNKLVEQGVCVIMISSELPEILGMADRILVMHEGKISGELPYQEATQEKIMFYATGGNK